MDTFNTRREELALAYAKAFAHETGARDAITALSEYLPPAAFAFCQQLRSDARATRNTALDALIDYNTTNPRGDVNEARLVAERTA